MVIAVVICAKCVDEQKLKGMVYGVWEISAGDKQALGKVPYALILLAQSYKFPMKHEQNIAPCIDCFVAYFHLLTRRPWAPSMIALIVWQRQKDFLLRD